MALIGKVIRSTRNNYLVYVDEKVLTCIVRGKIAGSSAGDGMAVKVGDNVRVQKLSLDEGLIEEILPRKSKLSRAVGGRSYREHVIATNVDQIVIIMSVKKPAFKSGLLDRYTVIVEKNRLRGTICINKIDLAKKEQFEIYSHWYPRLGYPLYFTSALDGQGIEDFKSILRNKVSVLVGHSGVGKSSLIKKVEPSLDLKVSDISTKTNKGKHATSFVELFPLTFGGYVIDTPGIRELGLWDIFRNDLKEYFVEFKKFADKCQFKDCSHINEPSCAVKAAIDSEKIFQQRHKNYCKIFHDLKTVPYKLTRR